MHHHNILVSLAAIVLIPIVCSCTVSNATTQDAWQTGWRSDNVIATPQTDL